MQSWDDVLILTISDIFYFDFKFVNDTTLRAERTLVVDLIGAVVPSM
jgi:hypothetical protein